MGRAGALDTSLSLSFLSLSANHKRLCAIQSKSKEKIPYKMIFSTVLSWRQSLFFLLGEIHFYVILTWYYLLCCILNTILNSFHKSHTFFFYFKSTATCQRLLEELGASGSVITTLLILSWCSPCRDFVTCCSDTLESISRCPSRNLYICLVVNSHWWIFRPVIGLIGHIQNTFHFWMISTYWTIHCRLVAYYVLRFSVFIR